MITAILAGIILILMVMNYYLWRSGSLRTAEHPKTVLDVPIMDPKEQKAIKKRLRRWKESGKLSREDFETFWALCQEEWNEP